MANITKVTISISEPVEKVWRLLMDPENLKKWLTGFISAEHLTGIPGEAGSTSKLTFMERGKKIEVTETILLVRPNQQYSFEMKNKSFEIKVDIQLVSYGHRTEMIQTEQIFPKAFFMKLLMPMMKGQMKKRMIRELEKFKNFAETRS